MKTVMCFGTFDILHPGHLHYLQQAKKYGDYLIVVIARDETKWRQRKSIIFNEQERRQLISSLSMVNEAVWGYPHNHLRIIIKKKPEVLCLGYDHSISEKTLAYKLARYGLHPIIRRISPYHPWQYQSSRLRRLLLQKPQPFPLGSDTK